MKSAPLALGLLLLSCSQPGEVLLIESLTGSGWMLDERLDAIRSVPSVPDDALGTSFIRSGFEGTGTLRFGFDHNDRALTRTVFEGEDRLVTKSELPAGTVDCRCAEGECFCVRRETTPESETTTLFRADPKGTKDLFQVPGFKGWLGLHEMGWFVLPVDRSEVMLLERNGSRWGIKGLPATHHIALDARGRAWIAVDGPLSTVDMRTGATEDVRSEGRHEVVGSTWDGSQVLVNRISGGLISWLVFDGRSGALQGTYEGAGEGRQKAKELCSSRGHLFVLGTGTVSMLGDKGLLRADYFDTLGTSLTIGCR